VDPLYFVCPSLIRSDSISDTMVVFALCAMSYSYGYKSLAITLPSLRSKATPLTKADPTLTPLPGLLLHLDMQQDLELEGILTLRLVDRMLLTPLLFLQALLLQALHIMHSVIDLEKALAQDMDLGEIVLPLPLLTCGMHSCLCFHWVN